MSSRFKAARGYSFLMLGCLGFSCLAAGQSVKPPAATIRKLAVVTRGDNFELEIGASRAVTPRTQVVTGPDRLVIDFPNSIPGPQLHNIAVKATHVRGVRAGLFESNPPVARVVVDLNSPQSFQLFPSGRSILVKINGSAPAAPAASAAPAIIASAGSIPPPIVSEPAKTGPPLRVDFNDGKLKVWTERATLGDVLRAIGRQTGATVSIPPRADQEPIAVNLGPASPREVLASLLNGSAYNIIVVGSGVDLSHVISITLTPRNSAAADAPANYAPAAVQEAAPEPAPEPEPEQALPPPMPSEQQDNPPPPVPDIPPPPQQ